VATVASDAALVSPPSDTDPSDRSEADIPVAAWGLCAGLSLPTVTVTAGDAPADPQGNGGGIVSFVWLDENEDVSRSFHKPKNRTNCIRQDIPSAMFADEFTRFPTY